MNSRVLIILGAILLVGGIAAACTSDTGDLESRTHTLEGEQASLSEELAALHDQILRASMVATLNVLDDIGFHELNMTIRDEGEAPAGTNGLIRTGLRAVAVTDWPDELDPAAQDFQTKLQTFFDALRAGDVSAQGDTSQAAHDAYHAFTGDAWNFLAESAGMGTGGAQEGHERDMDMGDGMEGMENGDQMQ